MTGASLLSDTRTPVRKKEGKKTIMLSCKNGLSFLFCKDNGCKLFLYVYGDIHTLVCKRTRNSMLTEILLDTTLTFMHGAHLFIDFSKLFLCQMKDKKFMSVYVNEN